MTTPSVSEVLDRVRDEFGERFVESRVEAENDARRLLDERAGRTPSAPVSGAEHPRGGVAELIPVPLRPGAPSSSELLALERAERLP